MHSDVRKLDSRRTGLTLLVLSLEGQQRTLQVCKCQHSQQTNRYRREIL